MQYDICCTNGGTAIVSESPVVGVALACIVIPMPEVLVSGLIGGGQEGVESTQSANKTAHTERERCGWDFIAWTEELLLA